MKQLKNLSAISSDMTQTAQATNNQGVRSVQSQQGFWRHIRITQGGSYFESSTGGKVFIPESELWALAEKSDANLIAPKIT